MAPGTKLLSNFDNPPENPLREGGNWMPVHVGSSVFGGIIIDMQKNGGNASNVQHGATLSGVIAYSYWTRQVWTGNHVEAWGYPVGGQLGAGLESWRLSLSTSLHPTSTGYMWLYGGGIGKQYFMRKYTGGYNTQIGDSGGGYPNGMMLRINGSQVEGWGMYGSTWSLMESVTDTTYRGPFYIVMGVEDPTSGNTYGNLGWAGIGGGVPNRTQIYRVVCPQA